MLRKMFRKTVRNCTFCDQILNVIEMAVHPFFERLLGVSDVYGVAEFTRHFVHDAVLPAHAIVRARTFRGGIGIAVA